MGWDGWKSENVENSPYRLLRGQPLKSPSKSKNKEKRKIRNRF